MSGGPPGKRNGQYRPTLGTASGSGSPPGERNGQYRHSERTWVKSKAPSQVPLARASEGIGQDANGLLDRSESELPLLMMFSQVKP
jgi:hypothetical protein